MRIIVFVITAILQSLAGVFGLFILLIILNGYSERHTTPGMILYLAVGLLSVFSLSIGSAFFAKRLVDRKRLGVIGASLTSTVVSSIIGLVILFAGLCGAAVLAEVLRKS